MRRAREKITTVKKKILREAELLHREARQRTAGYLLAAFGLVAALAWNDAVKMFIEVTFPLQSNTVIAKFFYAGFITLIVVGINIYIGRLFLEPEEEKKEEKKEK